MDEPWQHLIENSLADNTKKTYASAQKKFINFCEQFILIHDNRSPLPASELTLLRNIGHLSKTCKATSVRVYLSAVGSLRIEAGYDDPLLGCPRLPLVTRGLRRINSEVPKSKLPITSFVLHMIKLQLDFTKFDDVMFWAACLTAPFGFIRAPEFTTPPEGFNPARHLDVSDLSVDEKPVADTVFIHLKFSKTDQFGKGCTVVLARADDALCPVSALMLYLRWRGQSQGPLFKFSNGDFLTKSRMNNRLQCVLKKCGWPKTFTLHSFRVGAATTAALLGFPGYLIQALGRWTSDAYKLYIKLPQERLVATSLSLAAAQPLA